MISQRSAKLGVALALVAIGLVVSPIDAKPHHSTIWNWGGGKRIKGSGHLITEKRKLADFDEIVIQNSTDLEVKVGSPLDVEVEAEDNLMEYLTTEVDGGVLYISTDCNCSMTTRLGSRITISVPNLKAISIEGSSDTNVEGLKGPGFELTIAGSGDIELAGAVDELEVEIDGSDDVNAKRLSSKDAYVSINGSGDVLLTVEDNLDANINGSGDIRYAGTPRVRKSLNGSGSISSRP